MTTPAEAAGGAPPPEGAPPAPLESEGAFAPYPGPNAHAGSMVTRCGSILGTCAYMSPEQVLGRALEPQADLYSLGAVLHDLLTGRPPFEDEYDELKLFRRILKEEPAPPGAIAPGIPAALDVVVRRALAKEAASRFPSARAFAAALEALLPSLAPAPDALPPPRTTWGGVSALPTGTPARIGPWRCDAGLNGDGWFEEIAATDERSGAAVVLRPMRPHVLQMEALRKRVADDLRRGMRVRHPQVATILEVLDDESGLCAVCERSEGSPLDELVSSLGPLPPRVAVRLAVSALGALEGLHAARLLHLSISPDRLWLATDGLVKVGLVDPVPPPRGTLLPLGPQ